MKQEAEGNREELPPATRHSREGIPAVHGGEHVKQSRDEVEPATQQSDRQGKHPVDQYRPLRNLVPFGLQHVLVMAAAPISTVFLIRRSLSPSLAVPITESASAETVRAVAELCTQADAVLQMHVNEHLAAVERSLTTVGCRPLEYLDRIGVLGPHLLAAHATLLTPAELRLLADTGAAVSYNPVASAWKGNAVAPAASMAAGNVRFGIGTDGTRSDGFRLIDAAESAQRLVFGLTSGDSSCGAGWTWLEHATARGAEAVGLGASTGTIAVGKHADYLVVDMGVPEMQPLYDPVWQLVRQANRDQIVAVATEGRLRLWRGWPPDWDGPDLVTQATKAAAEVVARAPIQRIHSTATENQRRGIR